jgi:hypothetical protein
MSTTLVLNDSLFQQLQQQASLSQTTPQALLERVWQEFLQPQPQPSKPRPFRLKQATFKGQGLNENLATNEWSTLRELAYQEAEE